MRAMMRKGPNDDPRGTWSCEVAARRRRRRHFVHEALIRISAQLGEACTCSRGVSWGHHQKKRRQARLM